MHPYGIDWEEPEWEDFPIAIAQSSENRSTVPLSPDGESIPLRYIDSPGDSGTVVSAFEDLRYRDTGKSEFTKMLKEIEVAVRESRYKSNLRENAPKRTKIRTEDRPTSDSKLCPEWDGGVLKLDRGDGKEIKIPLTCGKKYCVACGEREAKKDMSMLWEGYNATWGNEPVRLLTLTFRARRSKFDVYGNLEYVEPWKQYAKRTGADLHIKLPENIDEMDHQELVKWMKPQEVANQVVLRALMTPQQQSKYLTGCIAVLRKKWAQAYNQPLTFVRCWELTQQGVWHCHLAYRVPRAANGKSVSPELVKSFVTKIWGLARGDETDVQVHPGTDYDGLGHCLAYVLKYLYKDNSLRGARADSEYRKLCQIRGEAWQEREWNFNLRRFGRSRDWSKPTCGDYRGYVTKEGEILNKDEWTKARGKFYNHFIKEGGMEKFIRDQDNPETVYSKQPNYVAEGPPDEFGLPSLIFKGWRAGQTWIKMLKVAMDYLRLKPLHKNKRLEAEVVWPEEHPPHYKAPTKGTFLSVWQMPGEYRVRMAT